MKKNIFFHEKNLKKTVESAVFELTDSSDRIAFSLLFTLSSKRLTFFLETVDPFLQDGLPFRSKRLTLSQL